MQARSDHDILFMALGSQVYGTGCSEEVNWRCRDISATCCEPCNVEYIVQGNKQTEYRPLHCVNVKLYTIDF